MATELVTEQREALDAFAASNGRSWKLKLRVEWDLGMPITVRQLPVAAGILRRLATSPDFGPRGLTKYKPAKVLPFDTRLEVYLAEPTLVRWEALAAEYIPGTGRTLWWSWAFVDGETPPSQSGSAWKTFPDAPAMRRAVKAAREGHVPVWSLPRQGLTGGLLGGAR